MLLTKDMLKQKKTVEYMDVDVPELGEGVSVRIIRMTSAAKEKYDNSLYQIESVGTGKNQTQKVKLLTEDKTFKLFAATMVNEDLTTMFTDAKEAKHFWGDHDCKITERIMLEIMRFNGMTEDAVDEAEKNYEATA